MNTEKKLTDPLMNSSYHVLLTIDHILYDNQLNSFMWETIKYFKKLIGIKYKYGT